MLHKPNAYVYKAHCHLIRNIHIMLFTIILYCLFHFLNLSIHCWTVSMFILFLYLLSLFFSLAFFHYKFTMQNWIIFIFILLLHFVFRLKLIITEWRKIICFFSCFHCVHSKKNYFIIIFNFFSFFWWNDGARCTLLCT